MQTTPPPRNVVLTIILVSYLMIVLDISIVIAALPKIELTLGFSHTGLSWVHSAYTLAFGGLLLLGARAGDILGRRRMLIIGLAIFTVASLVIGAAPTPAWFVAGRALQGVGAAALAPATLALLTAHFAEGPARTRAVGYYGAIAGIGASIGLVLGGLIVDGLSWRVGFLINLPIGIGLIWGAKRYLVESERQSGHFDLAGAISSALGMGSLVFALVHAAEAGWDDTLTLTSLAASVLLIAFLIFNEARAEQPIMPLRLFANRERVAAYAARVLFLGAMVGFWFFTTQFLQSVLEYTPFLAGLAFLPTTVPNFAAALLTPRLMHRFGLGPVLAAGLLIAMIGLIWLAQAQAYSHYLKSVALPLVLLGIGQGLVLGPLTVAGVAGVETKDAGAAAGVVNAAHQLGGSLGLGVLIDVFAAAGGGIDIEDAPAQLAQQIAAALSAGTIMLALALVIVMVFIVRTKAKPRLPGNARDSSAVRLE